MLTSVPAHTAFAMIMGYFAGLAKFRPDKESFYLLSGLTGAIVLHGLYDFFIFHEMSQSLTVYTFVTLIVALIVGKYLSLKHVHNSPQRPVDF
jgi:RsiW-degrading membrane proteinase PrsW (M82 family)